MTPTRAAIEERLRKATPGPWSIEACGEKGDGSNMIGVAFREDDHDCKNQLSGWLETFDDDGEEIPYYRDELVAECEHRNRNSHADADLIANAPTDIAFLLAEIDRLGKELETTRKALKPFAKMGDVEREEYTRHDIPIPTHPVMLSRSVMLSDLLAASAALATTLSPTEGDGE